MLGEDLVRESIVGNMENSHKIHSMINNYQEEN